MGNVGLPSVTTMEFLRLFSIVAHIRTAVLSILVASVH